MKKKETLPHHKPLNNTGCETTHSPPFFLTFCVLEVRPDLTLSFLLLLFLLSTPKNVCSGGYDVHHPSFPVILSLTSTSDYAVILADQMETSFLSTKNVNLNLSVLEFITESVASRSEADSVKRRSLSHTSSHSLFFPHFLSRVMVADCTQHVTCQLFPKEQQARKKEHDTRKHRCNQILVHCLFLPSPFSVTLFSSYNFYNSPLLV